MFSLFKRNKKGDLSLSINTIVILILAITMLGLGLAFLRGTFSKTTQQFQQVSGTVNQQISDEVKQSTVKLHVRGEPEITVVRGDTQEVFYGMKNVLNTEETFTVDGGCTTALSHTPTQNEVSFQFLKTQAVPSGQFVLGIMNIKVDPGANLDTYQCFMSLSSTDSPEYAKEPFYVKVTTS